MFFLSSNLYILCKKGLCRKKEKLWNLSFLKARRFYQEAEAISSQKEQHNFAETSQHSFHIFLYLSTVPEKKERIIKVELILCQSWWWVISLSWWERGSIMITKKLNLVLKHAKCEFGHQKPKRKKKVINHFFVLFFTFVKEEKIICIYYFLKRIYSFWGVKFCGKNAKLRIKNIYFWRY